MKKIVLVSLAVVYILGFIPSCGKKGSSDPCSNEAALQVTSSPAINSTEAPAPGPDFPVTITISSATLPSSGVTISVKASPEATGTAFFTDSKSSTTSVNTFSITGTPAITPSIVEITITSKSCPSNKFTGSFRYSKK